MPRTNGGIIGKRNLTSFGKCTVTVKTSSGNICAQPATRVIQATIVAGGASGGSNQGEGTGAGGGGAGGLKTFPSIDAGAPGTIPVVVGGGGALACGPSQRQGNPGNLDMIRRLHQKLMVTLEYRTGALLENK